MAKQRRQEMFKKAFMKKVAQISQKYKPVFFEPEKI